MAWLDPRFRQKKPKALPKQRFGETPCALPERPPPARPMTARPVTRAGSPPLASSTFRGSTAGASRPPARPASPPMARPANATTARSIAARGANMGGGIPQPRGMIRPPGGMGGLRPPSAGASGLRPPGFGSRRPQSPCEPEPPPCEPQPSAMPRPNFGIPRGIPRPAGVLPRPGGGIRPPASRIRPPGGSTFMQPKPQKIVLLPGDIDPAETTVITVETPQHQSSRRTSPPSRPVSAQMPSPVRSPSPCPSTPYSPSPASSPCALARSPSPRYSPRTPSPCARPHPSSPCARPRTPSPCPDQAWMDRMEAGPQEPYPAQPAAYNYAGPLLDITPPRGMGFNVTRQEPEDLIQWDMPQDPFSPPGPRRCESPPPQCKWFAGRQDPFSPPCANLGEYLRKAIPNYEDFERQNPNRGHPVMDYCRAVPSPEPFVSDYQFPQPLIDVRSPVAVVDREMVARSSPYNREVAALCKDDSDFSDDDEDFGLLPDDLESGAGADDLCAPLAARVQIQQQREAERLQEERRKREEPYLPENIQETMERIGNYRRDRELQNLGDFFDRCTQQPRQSMADAPCLPYERMMAKVRGDLLEEDIFTPGPSTYPPPPPSTHYGELCEEDEDLENIQMDFEDLDMDECD